MRIVFDHQCFQDQAEGGISRYVSFLARGLAERGHDVTVFAGICRCPALRTRFGEGVRVVGGIAMPELGQLWISLLNRVWFRIWCFGVRAEIYHPTYYRVLAGPRGARCVLTVYDFIHEIFPEVAAADPGLGSLKARAIARAGALLCISQKTRDDLARFCSGSIGRAHVVYLGSAMAPLISSAGKRQPYLLYVGTRRFYKNFKVLAVAFARSAELRERFALVLVGGEAELEEPLVGVRYQRVRASDGELTALYAGAAAFVYPSRYEGFGLPLIEAMGCGCPVVTSRGGALQEIAGDAAEFFEPDSPTDLIEAIGRVTGYAELRSRLIAAGRRRAEEFTCAHCVEKTMAVYQQLLTSDP